MAAIANRMRKAFEQNKNRTIKIGAVKTGLGRNGLIWSRISKLKAVILLEAAQEDLCS